MLKKLDMTSKIAKFHMLIPRTGQLKGNQHADDVKEGIGAIGGLKKF